jgi:hypothetical protein
MESDNDSYKSGIWFKLSESACLETSSDCLSTLVTSGGNETLALSVIQYLQNVGFVDDRSTVYRGFFDPNKNSTQLEVDTFFYNIRYSACLY